MQSIQLKRREFITLVGGAAAWPLAASAQQRSKPWRIGLLSLRPALFDGFREGMNDLGYVERKDFIIEPRSADGQSGRLATLAEELVRIEVNVIVAVGSPSIRAAQRATTQIPIVMAATGDAVLSGLVGSLARPGGNTTGLSFLSPDICTKQLQLMALMVPKLSRVALLLSPDSLTRTAVLKAVESAGRDGGITILPLEVGVAEELGRGFANLRRTQAEAVVVAPSGFLNQQARQIAELSIKFQLPSSTQFREFVEAGGLMSYGANPVSGARRIAAYVDKILRGVKPGEIPVEQPTKFDLLFNLRTAKVIGLDVPSTLLALADEVIE
jgi:putative ABC transport system substrate-binding protein